MFENIKIGDEVVIKDGWKENGLFLSYVIKINNKTFKTRNGQLFYISNGNSYGGKNFNKAIWPITSELKSEAIRQIQERKTINDRKRKENEIITMANKLSSRHLFNLDLDQLDKLFYSLKELIQDIK